MLKDLKKLLAECHWTSKDKLDFYKDADAKYCVYRVNEILEKNPKDLTKIEVQLCIKLLNILLYKVAQNGPVQHTQDKVIGTGSDNRKSDHESPEAIGLAGTPDSR